MLKDTNLVFAIEEWIDDRRIETLARVGPVSVA